MSGRAAADALPVYLPHLFAGNDFHIQKLNTFAYVKCSNIAGHGQESAVREGVKHLPCISLLYFRLLA
jgi:hypothetical protein